MSEDCGRLLSFFIIIISTPIIYSLCLGLLDVDSNESSEGGQSVEDVRRVVSSFTAAIEAWFATEPSSADVKAVDSEVPQLLKYDVATQGVSLHLPLHRALGGVLAEACKEWGFSMIDLLRINDKDPLRLLPFVSALLEGPLRAQVLSFRSFLLLSSRYL